MTCRRLYPAVVLVVVTASIVLAGCTSARNALGPAESPCFQALPVAHAAVNDTGHFSGVRYLTATQLTSALETVKKYTGGRLAIPAALLHQTSAVCAVAYYGHYKSSRVANGWAPGKTTGSFAIVVVRVPKIEVLITTVTRRPPLRLTKLFPSIV